VSSPNPAGGDSPTTPTANRGPRVGAFVAYELEDPYSPAGVHKGQGVVVQVAEDGSSATVVPLSAAQLHVAAAGLTSIKPTDVEVTTPQPEPADS
jgi:hypothetical protein